MVVRYYSSVTAETTLSLTINNSATSIQVGSVVGFPVLTPYTLALDYEGSTTELVDVTNAAGTTLTVVRAIDGTSAVGHTAGVRVRHVSSGRDFFDSRTHENSNDSVHGLGSGSNVVGTTTAQTLTNKTLTNPTINAAALSGTFSGTPTFSGIVTHSNQIILTDILRGSRALATDSMYESRVTGDANARFFTRADGRIAWGPGTTGFDTVLYRSAADTLMTDDQFFANRPLGTDVTFGGRRAADGNSRWYMTADGVLTLGDGAGAIDTNLYRSAANVLATDDSFTVGGNLTVTGINGSVHARKTADTNVTNNATPTPDPHLFIPVVANAVYEIDGILFATSASQTPDINIQLDGPAASAGTWHTIAPPTSATTDDSSVRTIATALGAARTYGLQTASQIFGFPLSGMIETAGNAGNLTVSWAQSTANATATTVKIYSWIRLTRVA